jgi:streptogrisin D
MSPFLPPRPGGPLRVLVLGLLLAVAAVLVAPAAGATPSGNGASGADPAATADRLTEALGTQAAGAYLGASGRLTVNVLDERAAAQVRAAGATPKRVARSSAGLERVKAALDAAAGTAPVGASWGVDLPSNTVLVSVPAGQGAAFVARARSFGAAVRIERTPAVHTQAFYGGQAIYRGGSRCSAGFNTRSGSGRNYVLTAGHCTGLGGTWTTSSRLTIGPVAASSFPGNDYGAIRISSPAALNPRGGVLHYGAFRDITGAGRVTVNSMACKTGSTTGTTCGRVLGYNVTVDYAEGTVFGLTRTNICTQPGDSGGAMYAGSLAQGITSGGTIGGCSQAGFRSFFQPAGEALGAYGQTLL